MFPCSLIWLLAGFSSLLGAGCRFLTIPGHVGLSTRAAQIPAPAFLQSEAVKEGKGDRRGNLCSLISKMISCNF